MDWGKATASIITIMQSKLFFIWFLSILCVHHRWGEETSADKTGNYPPHPSLAIWIILLNIKRETRLWYNYYWGKCRHNQVSGSYLHIRLHEEQDRKNSHRHTLVNEWERKLLRNLRKSGNKASEIIVKFNLRWKLCWG